MGLTYKKPNSLDKLIKSWVHPIFDNWVNSATRPGLQLSGKEKNSNGVTKSVESLQDSPVFVQRCTALLTLHLIKKRKKDLNLILFFSLWSLLHITHGSPSSSSLFPHHPLLLLSNIATILQHRWCALCWVQSSLWVWKNQKLFLPFLGRWSIWTLRLPRVQARVLHRFIPDYQI